jgi:TP901 family phage tail tape measure protein
MAETSKIQVGLDKDYFVKSAQDAFKAVERAGKINISLGKISGEISDFEKSLKAANARVLAFGASAGQLYAVKRGFEELVKTTISVEKSLTDINVILNENSEGLVRFSNNLFKIANSTGQSFSNIAKGAAEFARQGLGLEETLKRTRDAAILARLSSTDLGEAVRDITAALNSFDKAAINSTDLINKLANVDAKFAVSAGDLAEGIKRVGSSAQDVGVNIDELIALITSAQQTTSRGGAVIGNALKTIFQRVQRAEALDQLEVLGVKVRDTNREVLSATEILKNLAMTYDTLGQAQRASISELVGGIYQINVLKATLGDLSKEYSSYKDALDTSVNSTNQAIQRNEALNNTLAALVNRTGNNITQLAAKIGGLALGPGLSNILGSFNSVLESANGANGSQGIGAEIAKGAIEGFGQYITGPGAVIIGYAAFKLLRSFGEFATGALKVVLNINKSLESQAQLQNQVQSILSQNPQLINEILTGRKSVLQVENEILLALEGQLATEARIAAISSAIVPGLQAGGITVANGIVTKKNAAGGLTPGDIANEISAAHAIGYTPGQVKIAQGVVYNSRETVKSFPGLGMAVLPPNGTSAASQYHSNFKSKFGFNPYAAGGLMPELPDFKPGLMNKYASEVPLKSALDIAKEVVRKLQVQERAYNELINVIITTQQQSQVKVLQAAKTKSSYEASLFNMMDNSGGVPLNLLTPEERHTLLRDKIAANNQRLKDVALASASRATPGSQDLGFPPNIPLLQQQASQMVFGGGARYKLGQLAQTMPSAMQAFNQANVVRQQATTRAAFGIGIGVPVIAGAASNLVNNGTKRGRVAGAGLAGAADIASYASLGFMVGNVPGAIAGAGIGSLSALYRVSTELGTNLPELQRALDDTRKSIQRTDETFGSLAQVSEKLNALYNNEINLKYKDVNKLVDKQTGFLNQLPPELQAKARTALQEEGFPGLMRVQQDFNSAVPGSLAKASIPALIEKFRKSGEGFEKTSSNFFGASKYNLTEEGNDSVDEIINQILSLNGVGESLAKNPSSTAIFSRFQDGKAPVGTFKDAMMNIFNTSGNGTVGNKFMEGFDKFDVGKQRTIIQRFKERLEPQTLTQNKGAIEAEFAKNRQISKIKRGYSDDIFGISMLLDTQNRGMQSYGRIKGSNISSANELADIRGRGALDIAGIYENPFELNRLTQNEAIAKIGRQRGLDNYNLISSSYNPAIGAISGGISNFNGTIQQELSKEGLVPREQRMKTASAFAEQFSRFSETLNGLVASGQDPAAVVEEFVKSLFEQKEKIGKQLQNFENKTADPKDLEAQQKLLESALQSLSEAVDNTKNGLNELDAAQDNAVKATTTQARVNNQVSAFKQSMLIGGGIGNSLSKPGLLNASLSNSLYTQRVGQKTGDTGLVGQGAYEIAQMIKSMGGDLDSLPPELREQLVAGNASRMSKNFSNLGLSLEGGNFRDISQKQLLTEFGTSKGKPFRVVQTGGGNPSQLDMNYVRQLREQRNQEKLADGSFGLKDVSGTLIDQFRYNSRSMYTDLKDGVIDLSNIMKSSFADAFREFRTGAKSAKDALRDLGLNILGNIADKTFQIGLNSLIGGAIDIGKSAFGKGYSDGGVVVGGSGMRDDVPAKLKGGEYVINKDAVSRVGVGFLNSLNQGNMSHFADGGMARMTLANSYVFNDGKKPTSGRSIISPYLSNFALSDEDSLATSRRIGREDALYNYLQEKAQYDDSVRQALDEYKRAKRQGIVSSYISAGIGIAGGAVGAYAKSLNTPHLSKSYQEGSLSGGSNIAYAASGGFFKDTVPAMLTAGEVIINRGAVQRHGVAFFDRLNRGQVRRFANGGSTDYNAVGVESKVPIDISRINEAITQMVVVSQEISNSLKNSNKTDSRAGVTNSIQITVNVDKNGNASSDSVGNKKEANDDRTKASKFADLVETMVVKVINQEQRPGGLLAK